MLCELYFVCSQLQTWRRGETLEFMSDKYNEGCVYTNGNYTQKWITKLYNYEFVCWI